MRYGEPSIRAALHAIAQAHTERLLILPMYPQYSATTTASALDAVLRTEAHSANVPAVRWIKHFHDHPGYIAALRRTSSTTGSVTAARRSAAAYS